MEIVCAFMIVLKYPKSGTLNPKPYLFAREEMGSLHGLGKPLRVVGPPAVSLGFRFAGLGFRV